MKAGKYFGENMTCREFETVVAELARNSAAAADDALLPRIVDDPPVRQAGEAHAAACPCCAARFIAEERLTASLRALSASSSVEAGGAVESRLVEAFRRQHHPSASEAVVGKVVPFGARGRAPLYWAGSIAAAIALIALLVGPRTERQETATGVSPHVSPYVSEAISPTPQAPLRSLEAREPETQSRAMPVRRANPRRQQREPRMVATEFVPLERGGFIEPIDRGQLVRVQVPRMAMRNAGFPVREDRLTEPVLADVLVGEDGTARGIRFVKFTP